MHLIKQSLILLSALCILGVAGAEGIPMKRIGKAHPRLLAADDAAIKRNAETPAGKALAGRILYDADQLLKLPPQPRVMLGRRLLMASRNVLYRVNTLAVAWRLTGERKYADRAILEMCNAAGYSDWNPSHFLDVGEMTLALAIGYDWLYKLMTPGQRDTVARAIIDKGLLPSYQGKQWWIDGHNNWSPVCHSGMVAGAIAVADLEPELAEKTIRRAVEGMPNSMRASYEPNGAYPEGPMYWGYGTEFATVLLGLLDGAFGEDFGLSSGPGFARTGDFIQAVTAPSGQWFNYADCSRRRGSSYAMIWLVKRFNRPDWFGSAEERLLKEYAAMRPKSVEHGGNRLLPLALLRLDIPEIAVEPPLSFYSGDGSLVPIAVLRSDRTANAAWIGIKGGSPSGPHGHMDGGSFVFESEGGSWATDLGMENYTKIEATDSNLWAGAQDGDRWKLFRLGPASHNILRIDGAPQNVKGSARITKHSDTEVEMDLTSLYTPAVKKATRTVSLLPGRAMRTRDRLTGLRPGAEVTWQMCTEADAEALPDGTLMLSRGKKRLAVRKSVPGAWRIVPTEKLQMPFESANPKAKMVSFSVKAPENGRVEFETTLTPGAK